MCWEKNCYVSPCTCCSLCHCDKTCYDCFDVHQGYLSMTSREEHNSCDVRNKFVCFPCRRVWKSYYNKYISRIILNKSIDSSYYVPNIFPKNLTKKENTERRHKYFRCCGYKTDWSADFSDNPEDCSNEKPKCSKCGQEALSVGRNFRHCKTDKEWIEMERKVKNGEIDLRKDFRKYPKEGTIEYKNKLTQNYNNRKNNVF